MPTAELPTPTPLPGGASALPARIEDEARGRTLWQLGCFGLVGCMNTLVDLLALNCLLWLWPTRNTGLLLLANSLAYMLGALNSFLLNRAWTFRRRGRIHKGEMARFAAITLAGVACNDLILYALNSTHYPGQLNPVLWTNLTKVMAIGGTILVSYLGMRLWVFVQAAQEAPGQASSSALNDECSTTCSSEENTMSETNTTTAIATKQADLRNYPRTCMPLQQRLVLFMVMLTAIFMNFYQLGQNGFGNLFYAAGVRSMADSLHNFFFVSYDPGGFVTIDKPPLGFWLQTLSVKLFGFTPFSIFLPQALAGVLAVLLLFHLVRRHFGFPAGLLAALALALSPLSVATARNNTIDSTLVLTLLLAAWVMMLATETGRWRLLLLSAGLVGLGFNIKMMEAYLVVPALGLLYLLAAPRKLWLRMGQLLVAALLLLAVSLSWAIAVDLTPVPQRPYVGSSPNNSEMSLALGYNGIDRLLGRFGFGGNHASGNLAGSVPRQTSGNPTEITRGQTGGLLEQSTGKHGLNTDTPGLQRLFNQALGGQISWLLPFALLGLLALTWQRRPCFQKDRQQQALLLWGTWLFTMGIFFSVAGFFHAYYMTTFAPAICALFGIGCVIMWQDYRRANWRGWLLPCALILTAVEQIHFIASNPAWGFWLIPLIACVCVLAALLLGGARLLARRTASRRVLLPVLGAGLAALLLTPGLWSAVPAIQDVAIRTPAAGPSQKNAFARDNTQASPVLIHYLEANAGHTTFLAAAPSSMSANALILATNRPVMAMGGFAGGDPILTANRLAALVSSGTVRFFLLNNPASEAAPFIRGDVISAAQSGNAGFSFGRNGQPALTTWITHRCAMVPVSQWQPGPTNGTAGTSNAMQLYDCAAEK